MKQFLSIRINKKQINNISPPSHDSSKELQENKLSKIHDEIKELRNDLKVDKI
ncbi:unnamed protein product, partial [Lasius platythorax]